MSQRTALIIFGLAAALALAQNDPNAQKRVEKLENSLLAPCCWAETVARHNSEVAAQMRAEIAQFVAAGRSDREILDYYKQRYGERILVEPEGARWWLMNVVPLIFLALGLASVFFVLKRWRKPRPAS